MCGAASFVRSLCVSGPVSESSVSRGLDVKLKDASNARTLVAE